MTIATPTLPVPSFGFDDPEETGPPKSMLFFGDTGTRKTSMVGALYKAGFFKKILVINLDDSVEVLFTDPVVATAIKSGDINIKTFSEFAPNSRQEIEDVILDVAGLWRAPDGSINENSNIPAEYRERLYGYDLVVVDTLGILTSIGIKDFKKTTFNDAGTKLDGRAAYGRLGPWAREMVKVIHNSPRFAGLFLSHVKENELKTGQTKLVPNVDGGFVGTLPSIPSIVGFLDWQKRPDSDDIVLTATVGKSDIVTTKNRYGFDDKIYDFDVANMYFDIYTKLGLPLPVQANNTAVPTA